MSKPETIGQLRRKIEILEARLAKSEADMKHHFDVYVKHLYESTDAKMRITQAVRILTGDDEP